MEKSLKFILTAGTLILFFLYSSAQSDFKIGITMGPVFPLGDFKKTDNSSFSSGYSNNGFNLNVDGDYFLHNRFALSARFHLGTTTINGAQFSKRLKTELSDYLPADDSKEEIDFSINDWLWISPLIGFKYNYPISINLAYIEIGVFSGVNFTQIPDQNLYFLDNENKREIKSQNIENRDISLPVILNGSLRFRINEKMQLKISCDYFYTNVNYNHVSYINEQNSTVTIEINKKEFNVPIQTINASIGLVYTL